MQSKLLLHYLLMHFNQYNLHKNLFKRKLPFQIYYICRMKNFWLLFSIFFLSLSVYPCSENDDCEKILKTKASKIYSQQNKQQKVEHCTPFCTCSNCPATIFFIQITSYNLKNKVIAFQEKKLLSFYSFIDTKKIADKIWQPPKIS